MRFLFHASKEKSANLCHTRLLTYIVVMVLALERQMHRAGMQVIEMLHANTTEDRVRLESGIGTRCCLRDQLCSRSEGSHYGAKLHSNGSTLMNRCGLDAGRQVADSGVGCGGGRGQSFGDGFHDVFYHGVKADANDIAEAGGEVLSAGALGGEAFGRLERVLSAGGS